MKTRTLFAAVGVALVVTTTAFAETTFLPARDNHMLYGGNITTFKTAVDTIDLMGPTGSDAAYYGDFESGWNGWTSVDFTQPLPNHWQVSGYNQAVAGNLAAWCGTLDYAACAAPDVAGGYGDNWYDQLELRVTVNDPTQGATVHITATLQYDTEPGEDYVYLMASTAGEYWDTEIESWHFQGTASVDQSFTYLPSELVGGNEVVIKFVFRSDGAWSDEDCNWPTAGACQVDDITTTVAQDGQPDLTTFTDFQDGTFGAWQNPDALGVGDFAQLWTGLEDVDPCATNYSQQVAFIDDGVVVPGTGGSECINWCYGPMGYVVTTDGGLMPAYSNIWNSVLSPVMAWPDAGADGIDISFDVYRHEDLDADSPGIFHIWSVRSADTDDSAGNGTQIITEQPFVSHGSAQWGPGQYVRESYSVSDLMVAGRDEFQLQLGVYQLSWGYGWDGNDGYPAPYFDNAAVKIYPIAGPSLTARAEDLAQDGFPESDLLDYENLGTMNVRFDAARNISAPADLRNDPGDSIVVAVRALRAGSALVGPPEMHYAIDANPLFDAYRTVATSGSVTGVPAVGAGGVATPDLWAFDLPDTGALFPGDALHYYFRAADVVAGDEQYNTLPADLTGFGVFSGTPTYDLQFVVNALPTIIEYGTGYFWTPPILIWDDSGDPVLARQLIESMIDLGFGYKGQADKTIVTDNTFDFYATKAADLGAGNGLGGRTAGGSLAAYTDLIYRSGINTVHTLSQGDYTRDPGDDISTLQTWLAAGYKDLYLSGDGLASDLAENQGVPGSSWLYLVSGVDVTTNDMRPFISNQVSPLVEAESGNPVFSGLEQWVVNGGCPTINTVDGVTPLAGASRLAEFTDPSGNAGAYTFSAATLNFFQSTNRIITMPYDLAQIADVEPESPLARSTKVLGDVLVYFGFYGGGGPVPEVGSFSVTSYPNPFNPATRLEYTIDAPGRLTLKIYNVRGQLVRTLLDQDVQSSGHVMWDGTDAKGAQVSSGVYFREAQLGQNVLVEKMALIK